MRLRVSFEVRLDRDKPEEPEPHPQGDTFATAERADPAPVGFNIEMPDHG